MDSASAALSGAWPRLDYAAWRETGAALHLWAQIVGKYRLSHTPWLNHSWHATLYVTERGLTTGPVFDGARTITVDFDLTDHRLAARADGGAEAGFTLEPTSVAEFLTRTKAAIAELGGRPTIHGVPNELPDPTPFAEDALPRPYEREAVEQFHAALLRVQAVFEQFRTSFLGKSSPVHLFWGSFDLAVTRFSGRRAPLHPGGIPHLPDAITREAYSHEVASAGFWPGGAGYDEAMFYAYAYPQPERFGAASVTPSAARYDATLGEFVLPYEAVRAAADPEAELLGFLSSAYCAAADLGGWDRAALDCPPGRPGAPRPVTAP